MAEPRVVRPGQEGDRVARISPGVRLGPNQTAEDYLEIGDELLRSEGIDPTWRGFHATGADDTSR